MSNPTNQTGLLYNPIFKTPKKEFKGPKWNWGMLKPTLPELPGVTFSRCKETNEVVVMFKTKNGLPKTLSFEPEKFFKQMIRIIKDIKSIM
jgi:hypothetical protein